MKRTGRASKRRKQRELLVSTAASACVRVHPACDMHFSSLPQYLARGLSLLFIGDNPGLKSAAEGHHYAHPTNRFWPLLHESGLLPRRLTPSEDHEVLEHGIGLINICAQATRSSSEIRDEDFLLEKARVESIIREFKPQVVCFNGKRIYEVLSATKCSVGMQESSLFRTETRVYVVPSTSGRAGHYKYQQKLECFRELASLVHQLRERYA